MLLAVPSSYDTLSSVSQRFSRGASSGNLARAKGQLYNLDRNELLNFQFNPKDFEWKREIGWADITHKGDDYGGDLQFLRIGPRTFSLTLLFLADPGAPDIEWKTAGTERGKIAVSLGSRAAFGTEPTLKMNFAGLQALVESWEATIPTLGRPSRIRVMLGTVVLDVVITQSEFHLREFFGDNLACREAEVTLECREWNPRRM